MKSTLTDLVVTKARPKKTPYEIRDTKLVGFLLRVQPSGIKTFYFEYTRGKRRKICRSDALTVQEARRSAKKIMAQFFAEGDAAFQKPEILMVPTYGQYLENYYFNWIDQSHSNPIATKRRLLKDFEEFLERPLNRIEVSLVLKWRERMVGRGLEPQTINRTFNIFRASISKAVEVGILKEHPLKILKPLKVKVNNVVRYLTPSEEFRLRSALDDRQRQLRERRRMGNRNRERRGKPELPQIHSLPFVDHLKPMVLISMNTGVRRGELFNLRWEDVNMIRQQIVIRGIQSKTGKTRLIPLNSEAYSAMVTWREIAFENGDFVFTSRNGGRFVDIKTAWKRLLRVAEIENFRWHDLRHHFASKLAMAGVDLNTIRELLGHSNYEMTLRYAHLSDGHKAKAVEMLDNCQVD